MLDRHDKDALVVRLRIIQGYIGSAPAAAEDELANLIKEIQENGIIAPF